MFLEEQLLIRMKTFTINLVSLNLLNLNDFAGIMLSGRK